MKARSISLISFFAVMLMAKASFAAEIITIERQVAIPNKCLMTPLPLPSGVVCALREPTDGSRRRCAVAVAQTAAYGPKAAARKFVGAWFCIKIPMTAIAYKRPFDGQTSDRLLSTHSGHSSLSHRAQRRVSLWSTCWSAIMGVS